MKNYLKKSEPKNQDIQVLATVAISKKALNSIKGGNIISEEVIII